MARKRNDVSGATASRPPSGLARRIGLVRVPRSVLLRGTALQGVVAICAVMPVDYVYAQATNAHPMNPVTQLGSGSYSFNGTTTTINQTSNVLATGWSSFNVGSAQTVQINQPNAASISVNRVAVGDPSQIAGHIDANGVFVLVNPSGVVFAKGAQVNAASVIVSTADVSNRNLQAGKLVLDKAGKPGAMVINNGNITVKQTGLAALVAPGVANSGTISAPMGQVALAGAQAAVVDLYGDGLMSIDVTKQVTTVPTGPNGKPVTALVTNTGVIAATGGRVELTAQAVDGIVTTLVDAGGKISANTSKSGQTGTVVVSGIGGSLSIEGDISAAGNAPGTKGGAVELVASNAVNLAATARVNVSGKAGGGTAAIGTTLARAVGGPSVTGQATAQSVNIAAGARIKASATRHGNGGTVTVLSTEDTNMAGAIIARGGPLGGNGGFVEVSGYNAYSLTGSIDVTAAMGNAGGILIDPTNLVVINAGTATGDSIVAGGSIGANDVVMNETISNTELDSLTGNVTLLASNSLTFSNNASVVFTDNTNLTLSSGAGGITLNTGADIGVASGKTLNLVATSGGSIAVGDNITAGSSGGVTLSATGLIGLNGSLSAGVLDVSTTAGGNVTEAGGTVIVTTLQSATGVAGSVALGGSANNVGTIGNLSATGGFTLTNAGSVVVAGVVNAGTNAAVFNVGTNLLSLAGTVLGGSATLTTGTLVFAPSSSLGVTGLASLTASNANIDETNGFISAGTLAGSALTTAVFTNGASIANLGSFTTGGGFTLTTNAGSLTIEGLIGGGTGAVVIDNGNTGLAIGSTGSISAQSVALTGGSLDLDGGITDPGTLLLIANTGSIGQTASFSVGTLTGSAAADARFGGNNTVATLGSFTAGGTFVLNDGTALTVNNTVSASVIDISASSLAMDDGTNSGTLNAGGLISIQTGTLTTSNAPGIADVINAGTAGVIEFAPLASQPTIVFGGTGAGLVITPSASLTLIDGTLRLGAVNGTAVATSISIAAGANATTLGIFDLETQAGGIVSQDTVASAALDVTTLTGTAGSIALGNSLNAIATIAALTAPNGVTIANTGSTTLSGPLLVNSGTVVLTGNSVLNLTGSVSAEAAALTADTLLIPGTLNVTGLALLTSAGTDAGAGISESGVLNLGTLAGGSATSASFTGTNSIGALGSFSANSLVLNDGSADLSVTGPVLAGSALTLTTTGSISIPGTIGTTPADTPITVGITAGPSIDITGLFTDGGGTTTLVTNAGTVTGTGTIAIGTLTGSSAVLSLTGSGISVGTLSAYAVGNALTLIDSTALTAVFANGGGSVAVIQTPTLALGTGTTGGAVTATGMVSVSADTIVAGTGLGTIDAGANGVFELAGDSASVIVLGTASSTGTLGVDLDSLDITAGTLRLGSFNGTTLTTSIAIAGSGDLSSLSIGTLDLRTTSTGTVSQTDSLIVGTLTGSAGTVDLASNGNTIATLDGFTSTSDFTLSSGASLSVAAILSSGGAVVLETGTAGLGVAAGGGVTGTAVTLNAGSIDVAGSVAASNLLTLLSNQGSIAEVGTGSLGAVTLTGSAATFASLLGTNAVGTLGAFSATNGFTLANSGTDLTQTGLLDAHAGTVDINIGSHTLTIGGTVTAVAAVFLGGAVTEAGDASLNLGSLSGTVTGLANLQGVNDVSELDNFTAGTLLLNAGSIGLNVAGMVTIGNTIVLMDAGTIQVSSGGAITTAGSAIAISLNGSSIDIAGLVNDGGAGTTGLFTAGTITEETAGTLIAGTLSGSAAAAVLSAANNTIGTLGSFNAGSLVLNDAASLAVSGTVTIGTIVSITDTSTIDVTGAIVPTAGSTIAVGLTAGAGAADQLLISGLVSDGGNGTLSLVANTGTVAEPTTGTIIAGSLSGTADTVSLLGSHNAIADIAGLAGGNTLAVTDGSALTISGNLNSGSLIALTASTLTVDSTIAAPSVTLDASAGTLTLGGTVAIAATGTAVLDGLSSVAGGGGGVIGDGTVIANSTFGAVDLSNAGNIIGTIGGTAHAGFAANSGTALSVGNLSAGTSITIGSTDSLLVAGTVTPIDGVTAIAIGLTGTAIGIAGLLSDGGAGITSFDATAGGVTGAGTVIAGTISSIGTLFDLSGSNNAISALGSIVGASSIIASSTLALDITSGLSATTLIDISAAALTADTSIAAPSTTLVATTGTLALGSTIVAPNGVTLSGSLGIAGADAAIISGSLIANAGSGDIVLTNPGNQVSSVSGAAALGNVRFNDSTVLSIGTLTAAGTAAIGAPALGLTGTLSAEHVELLASMGSLDIASSARLTPSNDATLSAAGLLSVEGTIAPPSGSNIALALSGGTITISGLASDGGAGQTSLDVNTGTIIETGTLIAGTLTGTASLASLTDPGFSNMVGTLGASNFGTLILNDGTALTINGSVGIGTLVAIDDNSSITVAGTGAITPLAGSVIGVSLTGTGLDIAGLVSDGGQGQTTLSINGGTIAESGTLIAGTLAGTADTALLTNAANAVGTLDAFTATTSFALTDSTNVTIIGVVGGATDVDVTAPVIQLGDNGINTGTLSAASEGRLSITTGSIGVGTAGDGAGTLLATGGTIEIAPATTSDVVALGVAGSPGTLGIDFTSLVLNANVLVLGGHHGTVASGGIAIDTASSLSIPTLELLTSGTISQSASLGVGTLTGAAGSVALNLTSNNIGTLGAFHTTTDFDLGDGGTLVVAGPLTAGGTVTLDSTDLLTVTGGVSAAAASLSGSAITLSGSLGVTNGATLVASTGNISEPGSLTAASLSGSAAGTASFDGTNLVGTVAGFTAPNGFSITDGQSLTVASTLASTSGTIVLDTGSFDLSVPGMLIAAAATLSAGDIGLSGSANVSGLLSMLANQGSIVAGGNVDAGVLAGSAVSTASFTGLNNAVGTLAAFTAAQGFTLADTQGLTVSGAVLALSGTALVNDGSASLDLTGAVSAQAVSLSAGSVSLDGSADATGLLTLIANQGTIGQTVGFSAGTLTGSAASTALLTSANTLGVLGSFTASGGFSLTDTQALTVSGGVSSGGGTVSIDNGTQALGIPGTISAAAVALSAGSIDVSGGVIGNGLVSLTASQTGITEEGFVNAGTLTGSAVTAAAFTGTNAVSTLAAFTAPGGFTLDNGIALTQTGLLSAPGSAVVLNQGSNAAMLLGTINAGSLTLTAGNVTAPGTLSLTGTGSIAATGTIFDTGPILAGTLTGSASQASFIGSNSLTTIGDFNAAGGFTLDAVTDLTVAGVVKSPGGAVVISDDLHTDTINGTVTGAAVALTATTLLLNGTVAAPGLVTIDTDSGGGVTEAATAMLNAGTLSGSDAGIVSLTGTNGIASIGSLTATNGFTLTNGSSLQITTLLASSGTITIDDGGNPLTVAGTIQGSASSPVSLSADGITVSGGIGGGALTLDSGGGINATGSLDVISLQGSASTDASLTGSNTITTLNDFPVGAGFTLDNTASLSVAGLVRTTNGTVLIDNGTLAALDISGGISGPAVTLSAGTIALVGTGSLSAAGIVSLTAGAGGVNEANTAFLNAGTLIGLLTGAASLTGSNQIGVLGTFTAPAGFDLSDGESLSVAGPVTAASGTVILNTSGFDLGVPGSIGANAATLIADNIVIGGSIGVAGTADLLAAGSIFENGGLSAGLLTGTAASSADFIGSNLIGTLASFTAPGGVTVTDGEFLTVSGSVSAATGTVVVNTGSFGVSVSASAGISGLAETISAGSIDVSGNLDATSTIDLTASTGSIAVTGDISLPTGTLTGSAMTTASFTGTNTIGTIGAFSAPLGFNLSDAAALTVAGLVSSGGVVDINTGIFHLGDPGTISAASVTLAAGSIDIGGSLAATSAIDLIASTGSVAVTGGISLPTGALTGSAMTTASFTGTNTVGTLAAFTAPSGFTFDDDQALSVTGNVAASGGTIQIDTANFALGVTGGLSGQSATLAAGAITIGGSLGVGGSADLVASTGSISVTGGLTAGTLTGSAGTSATIDGTDLVTNLGAFAAPSGFTLVNGQALDVTGSVSASGGTVTLNTGNSLLSIAGTGAVTGLGAALTAGTLAIAGSLGVSGLADLAVGGGTITDTGAISAGTLAGTATLASLTGASATANQIGTLGNFTAGTLTLDDGQALTVAGSVSIGSSIAITDGGLVSVPGAIAPSSGDIAVAINAGTLAITGLVSDGGAGTTSLLVTGGTIDETTGTLVAGTLTGAAGTALLNGPSNDIAALGSFTAGATLVLVDTAALTQTDSLTASGLISLTASTLTSNGLISAPNTTLVATAGTLGLNGTVNATLAAVLTGQQGVFGGSALLTGGGVVTATSSLGAVTLTNPLNAVSGIDGSAATSFSVKDSESASVQTIAAGASVSIVDTGTLTVAGIVAPLSGTAIAVGLTAASISIPGLLSDGGAGTTSLAATGAVNETGSIIAGTLSASAASLTFSDTNTIAALGNISGGAQFVFGDTTPLTIAGDVAATTLVAITAPALTLSGTVAAATATLVASGGTLGFTGTIEAATAVVLEGSAGILGSTGLIAGGSALTAGSNAGSVVLTNAGNSIVSVTGTAAGDYLLADSGSIGLGNLSAGGIASVSATAISADGIVAASNVTLVASTGNIGIAGSIIPSASGTLSAVNGIVDVAAGAEIAPPGATGGIALALDAQQIIIAGIVSDGGAGTTSLIVPLSTGTIAETGFLTAGVLTGSANLADLVGGNVIAGLAAFSAGTLNLQDTAALTISGPVSIGGSVEIVDTAALSIAGALGPSGGAIDALLSASAITIGGAVSAGAGGSLALDATSGGITAPGAVTAADLNVQATGGSVSLTGGNLISTLSGAAVGGSLLADDGTSLSIIGPVTAGLSSASPSSIEIDVLGAGANLTVASGVEVLAGASGGTGNVTLRAGNDSLAGSVIVNGGLYAEGGGVVTVTAGYNVNSGAWNVIGTGSTITLTGTIFGNPSLSAVAGLVDLGAAGSIDENTTSAAIGASVLTGHAGGFANFGETSGGALASTGSANDIATLASFVSNANGGDNAQGFLLRDGEALTITGPVIDEGATNSRGVAISVVPPGYAAANLTISGEVAANTTVNTQATGSIVETAGGSIIARTLTTQAGVIPSTETQGNTAGTNPAIITANAASAFYGNASGQNVNQIGTLANVTTTGTLSLFDALSLTTAGSVISGITPAGSGTAGSVAIGTGTTLVSQGVLSIGGTLDVASEGGVLSLTAPTVDLGNSFGAATLKASTIQVFAGNGVTAGNNTVIDTGGDVFKRPASSTDVPVDPGPATRGAHFLVGSGGFTETGLLTVNAYTATNPAGAIVTAHPELDIRLTSGSGTINFGFGAGLNAPTTSLLLTLGSSGSAEGKVVADDIAVFYSGTNGSPTNLLATLFTSAGVQVVGQAAATQAFISRDNVFIPSSHFQVNACSIASVNCVSIAPFTSVPIVNPLANLPTDFLTDESDDPDLLIPNVTDQED